MGRTGMLVWLLVAVVVLLASHSALAGVTTRVSVASSGEEGNANSGEQTLDVSADGRYVAFNSSASNLVLGDTNGYMDDFVRDALAGTTELVSVSSAGEQGNDQSWDLAISADGRYVAFRSIAWNLVSGGSQYTSNIFVRDRLAATTELVSVSTAGEPAIDAGFPCISADGRYVAFNSGADNLVPGDTNGCEDVFVHDRQTGVTSRVSVATGGGEANSHSSLGHAGCSISADGRFVAFDSSATNLVPDDTNGREDVFLHDRLTGQTERVSLSSDGAQGNGDSGWPRISADDRYVTFVSGASNLVPGEIHGGIFVRDRTTARTEHVSVSSNGAHVYGEHPSISGDGRYVAFVSSSAILVPADTNGCADVFVHDRLTGQTERASVSSSGEQGNNRSWGCISADGRYVVFESAASNLVPGDTNWCADVFVHDRYGTGTPPPPGSGPGYDTPSTTVLRVRNPYADGVAKRVKGQLHCHFYNDAEYEWDDHYVGMLGFGSLPPEMLLASYAARGYDFVCVTEHNHCTSDPLVSPALFVRYCEEVTRTFGHVLAISETPAQPAPLRQEERRYIPWDGGNSFGEVLETSPSSVTDVVNTIKDRNGLAIVAHPCLGKYPVSAGEIWNARPNGISVYTAASFTNSESRWNELLTAGMFIPTDSSGRMLLFGATEDDYTPPITPYAHGRTWVIAELDSDDLTQTNIVSALKNGRYWSYRSLASHFGTGPILHLTTSTNGDGKPVIQVTSDRLVDDIAFVYRNKDTGIEVNRHWGPVSYAEYTCEGDEVFVRVQASQGDIIVYSQPVAVVWEWTSGGTGNISAASRTPLAGTPADLVLTCALPDQLPDKSPPVGYIGRAYLASTTSETYPEDSTLTLSYEGLDVTPYGTSNVAMYRWNSSGNAWAKLTSNVDIGNALVTAPLTQAGLYTISAEIVGDATAPTVTIHTPTGGATLSGPGVVGVQAYDNVGVLRTSFFLGDQDIGTDSTGFDGYTCEYDFSKKAAGTYTLKVIAEDVTGNAGQAEVQVTVASTGAAPAVSIASPSTGADLQGTATIMGNCSDNTLVAGVFILADGVPVGEADVTGTGWTYDLDTGLLANGPHTLTAQAMDEDLNRTETSVSATVSSPTLSSLAAAKALPDGDRARVAGRVVTFGDPGFEGGFYVEEQQRFSGIRVEGGFVPAQGDMVSVSGVMSTDSGEREIVGADVLVMSSSNPLPGPLGLGNIFLGGTGIGNFPVAPSAGFGLSNLGLLVRTWGTVTYVDPAGTFAYVDDGSVLSDGNALGSGGSPVTGVRIILPSGVSVPSAGYFLVITGISSCTTVSGAAARAVLVRSQSDISAVLSVSGRVTLQAYSAPVTQIPVTVELREHGGPTSTRIVNLDSSGNYTLRYVRPGVYDLAFKASHWLRRVVTDVSVWDSVTGIDVSLINGDINGDNVIDSLDYDIMNEDWFTSNPRSDLNGDGIVNGGDFAILNANWGAAGDP